MNRATKGLAALITAAIQRLYPDLKIDKETVGELLVASAERGADIKFLASRCAAEFGLEVPAFISSLYLGLVVEQEKEWSEREFYGISRDDEAIYFRLVDDSTS